MASPEQTSSSRAVQYRPVCDLIPCARNSRNHSEEQISQIAASIREFGFTNPILVDGANGIIAGHGRLAAERLIELKTVPCIELGHLSEAWKPPISSRTINWPSTAAGTRTFCG